MQVWVWGTALVWAYFGRFRLSMHLSSLFLYISISETPESFSRAVLGIRGAMRVEVVEGQHVSVPQPCL